jgi:hypothetical protein
MRGEYEVEEKWRDEDVLWIIDYVLVGWRLDLSK